MFLVVLLAYSDKSTLRPGQTKSLGIDDGFKGPGAACGSSVIRVAHQMVNLSRPFTRGFTVAHLEEAQPEADLPDAGALQKNATSIRGKSIETTSRAQGVEETAVAPPASNMMRRDRNRCQLLQWVRQRPSGRIPTSRGSSRRRVTTMETQNTNGEFQRGFWQES